MGTGTGGASERAAGLTALAAGKTKSRQSRGGRAARKGAGKASSFFSDAMAAGEVRSLSCPVLIEVHIVQGCSPSNVFFMPESHDPSSCEYVRSIPAHATVCRAPQWPPAMRNIAAAAAT